jgi:hypothetical protein
MTKRIFSYPAYAEPEADSIRQLLTTHHIEFFETPASRWGFTHAAIWIKHDQDTDIAKRLLEQHYLEFAEQARRQFQIETGYSPDAPWTAKIIFSIKHILKRKIALLVLAAGFLLLYVYISMFFSLFR